MWKSINVIHHINTLKDKRQEEKGMREDEMVGWHYQLNGHKFGQVPVDYVGQGSLVGGHKESDATERLHFHFSISCIGEGNGNPFQRSCLENPRDGGA